MLPPLRVTFEERSVIVAGVPRHDVFERENCGPDSGPERLKASPYHACRVQTGATERREVDVSP